MKTFIQLGCIIGFGSIGAAVPVVLFYQFWAWCMEQIPLASEWAGLAKIVVTLLMVFLGGGATIGLAILGAVFLGGPVAPLILAMDERRVRR